jgi:hypothetical protein
MNREPGDLPLPFIILHGKEGFFGVVCQESLFLFLAATGGSYEFT